jgi:hypothetical protein
MYHNSYYQHVFEYVIKHEIMNPNTIEQEFRDLPQSIIIVIEPYELNEIAMKPIK